jgi:hypothetical protein
MTTKEKTCAPRQGWGTRQLNKIGDEMVMVSGRLDESAKTLQKEVIAALQQLQK